MKNHLPMGLTPTQARDWASSLASSDPFVALASAREVSDPWFGCQALAWVGRFWPSQDFGMIIGEAIEVGWKQGDPYRVVASASWPLRAFIERGLAERVSAILPRLLTLSSEIENVGSRSEALFLLFQGVQPGGQKIWLPVLDELVKACYPTLHWRQGRNLREAILIVAAEDVELATDIQRRLPDDGLKVQIEKMLRAADRPKMGVRGFFWA